jgi:hypothetical protein
VLPNLFSIDRQLAYVRGEERPSRSLEPFPAKWIRFAVESASDKKTRADSPDVETVLGPPALPG